MNIIENINEGRKEFNEMELKYYYEKYPFSMVKMLVKGAMVKLNDDINKKGGSKNGKTSM